MSVIYCITKQFTFTFYSGGVMIYFDRIEVVNSLAPSAGQHLVSLMVFDISVTMVNSQFWLLLLNLVQLAIQKNPDISIMSIYMKLKFDFNIENSA